MSKHLLKFSIVLFTYFIINSANACRCDGVTFEEMSNSSDLIFKGIVINKKDSISIGKVFYTFKSNEIWKGLDSPNIIIETNYGGPACGENFSVNTEYVVYSFHNQTTRCGRNCLASTCSDIALLNFKFKKSYKQNIAIDALPLLSNFESDYFNFLFSYRNAHNENLDKVDFTNKKIAFLDNKKMISKPDYFKLYGDKSVSIYFDKFSTTEIINSGFYGIVYMNRKKPLSKQQKRKLLKLIS